MKANNLTVGPYLPEVETYIEGKVQARPAYLKFTSDFAMDALNIKMFL